MITNGSELTIVVPVLPHWTEGDLIKDVRERVEQMALGSGFSNVGALVYDGIIDPPEDEPDPHADIREAGLVLHQWRTSASR